MNLGKPNDCQSDWGMGEVLVVQFLRIINSEVGQSYDIGYLSDTSARAHNIAIQFANCTGNNNSLLSASGMGSPSKHMNRLSELYH